MEIAIWLFEGEIYYQTVAFDVRPLVNSTLETFRSQMYSHSNFIACIMDYNTVAIRILVSASYVFDMNISSALFIQKSE